MKEKKGLLIFHKILLNLDLFIASIALIVLVFVTSANVVMRYIVKNPFLWTEEVQSFCQVWMVFLGGSVAFRMGSIVAIEMVVEAMPKKAQKIMGYVIDAFVIFVLLYLATHANMYISQTFGRSGRATAFLKIPYTLIYGVTPYGCVLMIISYLMNRHLPQFVRKIDIDANMGEVELVAPGSEEESAVRLAKETEVKEGTRK